MSTCVAVAGCGYWGKNLVRNFHELGALGGVCDPDAAAVARMQDAYEGLHAFGSFDEVLASPEVAGVCLATPADAHFGMARDALRAGKHVFVEKPLALNAADGRALVSLAEEQARILMVGHLLEYHPAVAALKAIVDEGRLGKVQCIYSNRLNLGKIRRVENILWSFAPHDISVILLLLGEMPEEVAAHGRAYLDDTIADTTISYMSFRSGASAHVFVSWLHPFKEQKLVVVGDAGMAVFEDTCADKLKLYSHHIDWIDRMPVPRKAAPEVVSIAGDEPLRLECEHFLECIESGKPPKTDGANGLRVVEVLEACQHSLDAGGKVVKLADLAAQKPALEQGYFVHPTAVVDEPAQIGAGAKIWHFAHIMPNTTIGENCVLGQNVLAGPDVVIGNGCKIQNNVAVYKGVTLEDHVFCGPSMVFTNVLNPRSEISRKHEFQPTLVKRGATLGANSTIICGHTIGEYAFVGAGAVVTRDVPAYAIVIGVPARQVGWICRCGVKLGMADGRGACPECGRVYFETAADRLEPQEA